MGWRKYRRVTLAAGFAASLLLLSACNSTRVDQFTPNDIDVAADTTLQPYAALSEPDRALAWEVRQRALEKRKSGESESWTSDTTSARGTVTPVRTWKTRAGIFCREFEERFETSAGKQLKNTASACRDREGLWLSVIDGQRQS